MRYSTFARSCARARELWVEREPRREQHTLRRHVHAGRVRVECRGVIRGCAFSHSSTTGRRKLLGVGHGRRPHCWIDAMELGGLPRVQRFSVRYPFVAHTPTPTPTPTHTLTHANRWTPPHTCCMDEIGTKYQPLTRAAWTAIGKFIAGKP